MKKSFRPGDDTQGSEIVFFTTPDSISSYVISGVSFSGSSGAGIPAEAPSMVTFLQFFLQMDLPFSMKQSETLTQPITVFNYMPQQQNALVSLDHDIKFTIEDPTLEWQGLKVLKLLKAFNFNFSFQFYLTNTRRTLYRSLNPFKPS